MPGHERFIATTLAGLGPAPVALLVVAADDPWMPQAAEHLAALDALGVTHGVLVVTRSDLADPGPALARARAEVDRTSLAGAPDVVVCGRTGSGVDRLRTVLGEVLARVPAPDPDADVRLWVDRRFHVLGTGTVVTGTLVSGSVAAGDVLTAGTEEVRVRRVEALGRTRERVGAVARVALDLGGRAPAAAARGHALLSPDAFNHTGVVDVALAGGDTDVPERPVLHLGSALVGTRARELGNGFWRLDTERPLPLRVGDRGVLRDPGSRHLWGLTVLDPAPPALRRRGAASARARALATADRSLAGDLARRGVASAALVHRIGLRGDLPPGTVAAGDWLVGPEAADRLRHRLARLVEESSATGGVAPAAAARALGLPDVDLVGALAAPPVRVVDGRLRVGDDPDVPSAAARALEALAAELADRPFAAPEAARLAALGLDDATVAGLHRAHLVLRLAPAVVLLRGADDAATELLRGLEQPFTTSAARQALGTSRRVALPLLAHLDATGRTLRLPDDRRRVRAPRNGRPTGGPGS